MALHSEPERLDQLKPGRGHGQVCNIPEGSYLTKKQDRISKRLSANQGIRHQPDKACLGNRAKKKPGGPNRPVPPYGSSVTGVVSIA